MPTWNTENYYRSAIQHRPRRMALLCGYSRRARAALTAERMVMPTEPESSEDPATPSVDAATHGRELAARALLAGADGSQQRVSDLLGVSRRTIGRMANTDLSTALRDADALAADHLGMRPEMRRIGRMVRFSIGVAAAIVVIVLITLRPFLPGEYDMLAEPMALMVRAFAFFGLLAVPFSFSRVGRFVLAGAGFLAALSPVAGGSLALAFGSLFVWALVVFRLRPRVPALYMLIVPPAAFLLQWQLLPRAVEFSRNRAIANAAPLIADVEAYRAARGAYPLSLLATQRDYKPGIIGVDRYRYEPSGRAYNVLFELPSITLGTQEIIIYNPLDEQQVTAHPMDILQYTPEHLERTRGYYGSRAAPQPHWKYFWFD